MTKILLVGLGNPGAEYALTRHNIGFAVLDFLAAKHGLTWSLERHGWIARMKLKNKQLILLKPSTYMNLSGKALQHWQKAEGINLADCLVITDDLNLDFAKVRLRPKGSAGGHNGLTDIETRLGSQDYPRMRVGIGSGFSRGRQVDYVLGEWTEAEREVLPNLLEHTAKACEDFALQGLALAMNLYNKQIS